MMLPGPDQYTHGAPFRNRSILALTRSPFLGTYLGWINTVRGNADRKIVGWKLPPTAGANRALLSSGWEFSRLEVTTWNLKPFFNELKAHPKTTQHSALQLSQAVSLLSHV